MKHIELIGDYHKVLRMIKNYSAYEVESLLKAIEGYLDILKSGDQTASEDEVPKGLDVVGLEK